MSHAPQSNWRPAIFSLSVLAGAGCILLSLAVFMVSFIRPPQPGLPAVETTATLSAQTAALVPTFTPTFPAMPSTPTPSLPSEPTPVSTPVVQSAQHLPRNAAARSSEFDLTVLANSLPSQTQFRAGSGRFGKKVLAHYFAWFGGNGWDDCNISGGDKPLQPYDSDDVNAIARHVAMAREVGLNGFLLHWFVPGGRTDRNFGTLLAQSKGHPFASTVVFSRHIYHGAAANRGDVATALSYIVERYGSHGNFLKVGTRPVIFFTDMYRVPTSAGESPQQFWAAMRNQVDPQRRMVWIAEGLDSSYLTVFDGLYVFKLTHASSPADYEKSSHWAAKVRAVEGKKLWAATFGPGWDDLRAGCRPDVRVPAPLHRNDRENGAFFRRTFEAAQRSDPDWLILGSFNEWVEGSYVEPSVLYGDKYLRMTGELIREFRRR